MGHNELPRDAPSVLPSAKTKIPLYMDFFIDQSIFSGCLQSMTSSSKPKDLFAHSNLLHTQTQKRLIISYFSKKQCLYLRS